MILAEWATQITAVTSNGKDLASGHKPSKRLLLNGIQGKGSNPAVIYRFNHTVLAGSHLAEASAAFINFTVSEAYLAFCHKKAPYDLYSKP